ncbi:MAG: hypothetical protein K0S38_567 [Candidatus Paceibacter sp.]|jgi:hypothetical protein|nr:hypothetical protein [Candidatus Paceibacter sp.]
MIWIKIGASIIAVTIIAAMIYFAWYCIKRNSKENAEYHRVEKLKGAIRNRLKSTQPQDPS